MHSLFDAQYFSRLRVDLPNRSFVAIAIVNHASEDELFVECTVIRTLNGTFDGFKDYPGNTKRCVKFDYVRAYISYTEIHHCFVAGKRGGL